MAHARKTIRDNIKTTLTGLTTTGSNVFQSRVYPMHRSKLPGLLIYNKAEEIEYRAITSPRLQHRTASYDVEIYVMATENYDNDLDKISVEVEEALATDTTRGGNAEDTRIISYDIDFNGDGDQPVAVARIAVEVTYQVRENNPDVII